MLPDMSQPLRGTGFGGDIIFKHSYRLNERWMLPKDAITFLCGNGMSHNEAMTYLDSLIENEWKWTNKD